MGSGTDDVWAVGYSGSIAHWNGSVWEEVPSGNNEYLYSVWALNPATAFISGTNGTVLRWNGQEAVAIDTPFSKAVLSAQRDLSQQPPFERLIPGCRIQKPVSDSAHMKIIELRDAPYLQFCSLELADAIFGEEEANGSTFGLSCQFIQAPALNRCVAVELEGKRVEDIHAGRLFRKGVGQLRCLAA